ncbi:MAG: 16S rRNA (cytosine(1402)-N(4))-methyltransferase RsmH [Acidimicrobiales bacterium]
MRSPSTSRVGVPFSARFHSVRSGRHPDGALVGGLRMSREDALQDSDISDDAAAPFVHRPVMVGEIVELFGTVPAGVVLDATLGAGGHAGALLDAHPHLRLVGMDQDPSAVAAGGAALARFGDRARVARARFDALAGVIDHLGVGALSGALFDLGVSSPQLDRATRGFSYRADAPLDMRMDPDRPGRAADVVNTWPAERLARLVADNGEPRFARRIAAAIVAARPLETTGELAQVVREAIPAPARRRGGHPARRVFQAVRIAVNEELDILPSALDTAIDRLAPGGRIAVLSYHSGEDRIVKDRFRQAATGGCVCPAGMPCGCGATPTVRLLNRGARRPGAAELESNRRAESARLRAAERLGGATTGQR